MTSAGHSEKGVVGAEAHPAQEVSDQKLALRSIHFQLHTLFLFTRSDFKTAVAPQLIFAIAAVLTGSSLAGVEEVPPWRAVLCRVPLAFVWIWTNLLVENIANQRLPKSIIEDHTNKPWRPIPSGRITASHAQRLLLAVIPFTLGLSALLGAFLPSVTLMTFVWMYDDLEGSGIDIWTRNLLSGSGLMCFSWGALRVLSGAELKPAAYTWILVTGLITGTTVHAQDFADAEGDRKAGRQTVPLLHGETFARVSLAVAVMIWSVACPAFWKATLDGYIGPLAVGGSLAVLTLARRTQSSNDIVWKLWCLWITVIYLTPLFGTR